MVGHGISEASTVGDLVLEIWKAHQFWGVSTWGPVMFVLQFAPDHKADYFLGWGFVQVFFLFWGGWVEGVS